MMNSGTIKKASSHNPPGASSAQARRSAVWDSQARTLPRRLDNLFPVENPAGRRVPCDKNAIAPSPVQRWTGVENVVDGAGQGVRSDGHIREWMELHPFGTDRDPHPRSSLDCRTW